MFNQSKEHKQSRARKTSTTQRHKSDQFTRRHWRTYQTYPAMTSHVIRSVPSPTKLSDLTAVRIAHSAAQSNRFTRSGPTSKSKKHTSWKNWVQTQETCSNILTHASDCKQLKAVRAYAPLPPVGRKFFSGCLTPTAWHEVSATQTSINRVNVPFCVNQHRHGEAWKGVTGHQKQFTASNLICLHKRTMKVISRWGNSF